MGTRVSPGLVWGLLAKRVRGLPETPARANQHPCALPCSNLKSPEMSVPSCVLALAWERLSI